MAEFKKMCCAVDLSESSRLAMKEAADLARRYASDLTLIYVFEPPKGTSELLIAPLPEFYDKAARELRDQLELWRREAESLGGRPVKAELLFGSAASEILRFTQENLSELIVMGTHGHGGLKRLVLGSVAGRVVQEASCPVLVVRPIHRLEAA